MGNVNMEAKQIHDRTEAGKHQSVADHLKSLDAIAASIENLPTFTSNDRAFLEALPAFPTADGSKVLTATTSSGETTLSYEEAGESGENQIYSTTPVECGTWSDGSKVYRKVYTFGAVAGGQPLSIPHGVSNLGTIVKLVGNCVRTSGTRCPIPYTDDDVSYQRSIQLYEDNIQITGYSNSHALSGGNVIFEYTVQTV